MRLTSASVRSVRSITSYAFRRVSDCSSFRGSMPCPSHLALGGHYEGRGARDIHGIRQAASRPSINDRMTGTAPSGAVSAFMMLRLRASALPPHPCRAAAPSECAPSHRPAGGFPARPPACGPRPGRSRSACAHARASPCPCHPCLRHRPGGSVPASAGPGRPRYWKWTRSPDRPTAPAATPPGHRSWRPKSPCRPCTGPPPDTAAPAPAGWLRHGPPSIPASRRNPRDASPAPFPPCRTGAGGSSRACHDHTSPPRSGSTAYAPSAAAAAPRPAGSRPPPSSSATPRWSESGTSWPAPPDPTPPARPLSRPPVPGHPVSAPGTGLPRTWAAARCRTVRKHSPDTACSTRYSHAAWCACPA